MEKVHSVKNPHKCGYANLQVCVHVGVYIACDH